MPNDAMVALRLDRPPEVASLGVGVHGTVRRQDVFRLRDLWQLHLYRYQAELDIDGTRFAIRPGYVSLVPPDTVVTYRYRGRSEHLYVHLRLPVPSPRDDSERVRMVQDSGAEMPALSGLLLGAISAWPRSPAWASAEVWTVLWRVTHLADRIDGGRPHDAVARAIAFIESRLAEPLTVPDVARAAGVSHNHLTRLFRAETGSTVIAYIRRRRMERARHLLRESTLPIPTVAASVGISDLQAFNKACRRELGASPRTLRGS